MLRLYTSPAESKRNPVLATRLFRGKHFSQAGREIRKRNPVYRPRDQVAIDLHLLLFVQIQRLIELFIVGKCDPLHLNGIAYRGLCHDQALRALHIIVDRMGYCGHQAHMPQIFQVKQKVLAPTQSFRALQLFPLDDATPV